jgi:hypothetical protein
MHIVLNCLNTNFHIEHYAVTNCQSCLLSQVSRYCLFNSEIKLSKHSCKAFLYLMEYCVVFVKLKIINCYLWLLYWHSITMDRGICLIAINAIYRLSIYLIDRCIVKLQYNCFFVTRVQLNCLFTICQSFLYLMGYLYWLVAIYQTSLPSYKLVNQLLILFFFSNS